MRPDQKAKGRRIIAGGLIGDAEDAVVEVDEKLLRGLRALVVEIPVRRTERL